LQRTHTSGPEFAKTPEQPWIGANHWRPWSDRRDQYRQTRRALLMRRDAVAM